MSQLNHLKSLYVQLMHAMQSGVAAQMHKDPTETSPKHLRVGVNSALTDSSALVELLIRKGIITEEEFYAALVAMAKAEVDNYSKLLGGVELR